MNRTIKLLMFSDIFVLTGFGLISPILAVYVKENLVGGTLLAAGIASTIFMITKCVVQLSFSRYVDRHDDKVLWLLIGTFLISAVPFLYIFAKSVTFIYLAQFIHGIASGLAFPTWLGLWSTNLDKRQESFEWSLYSTLTGLGTAATAAVGAALAQRLGFNYLFVAVGIMSLIGSSILFGLEKSSEKKKAGIKYFSKRKNSNH